MIVVLSHARSIADRIGDDSAVRLDEIDLSKRPEVLARTSSMLSSIEHSYLCRIVALADLLDLVSRRVLLRDEVRHADDFVLFVIFDYIGLLDYWHKVFSMADLALQSTPDLQDILSVYATFLLCLKQSGEQERKEPNCTYLITRQNRIRARRVNGFGVRAVNVNHDSTALSEAGWIALLTTRALLITDHQGRLLSGHLLGVSPPRAT